MPGVTVTPASPGNTHDISLSDGVETWGITLKDRAAGIQEVPNVAATTRASDIEQRDWSGGRGQENFAEDATRFFDSKECWTLTPGFAMPAPQWRFGVGYRLADQYTPASGLQLSATATTSMSIYGYRFTVGATGYTAKNILLWCQKLRASGEVMAPYIYADVGGGGAGTKPGADTGYAGTAYVSYLPDNQQIVPYTITDPTGVALSASTAYWLGISSSLSDVRFAFCGTKDEEEARSVDGTNWVTTDPGAPFTGLMYRITGADTDQIFRFARYKGALLAASEPAGGTAGKLYINGDWGVATGASQSTTVLQDTTKTWTTNEWANCFLYFTAGKMARKGRKIVSNTAAAITVASFPVAPVAGTDTYVIVGSDKWTDISPAAGDQIDNPVLGLVAAGTYLYLAGAADTTNKVMLRYDAYLSGAVWTLRSEDDHTNTQKARSVCSYVDSGDSPGSYLAWTNSSTGHAWKAAHPTSWTDLSPTDMGLVGNQEYAPTGIVEFDGHLYVGKEDGLYHNPSMAANKWPKIAVDLSSNLHPHNMESMAIMDQFLYFNWSHSIERFLPPSQLDDIGPWKGAGLPDGRGGHISCMLPVIGWLFVGIDAGQNGTSSVLVYNERGYHEIFRAWTTGKRVTSLFWQAFPNHRPRLWIGVGGDLVYMDFPLDTLNPLQDSGHNYQPEAHLITSSIDMNAASLPKFFKELALSTRNLDADASVAVDYQADKDVGGATWIEAGIAWRSPEELIRIVRGGLRKIRLRFRLRTQDADQPPVIEASVLKAFARTPYKRQFNMRIKLRDDAVTKIGTPDAGASELADFLRSAALNARVLYMRTAFPDIDDLWVIPEPPSVFRDFFNTMIGKLSGSIAISLREG